MIRSTLAALRSYRYVPGRSPCCGRWPGPVEPGGSCGAARTLAGRHCCERTAWPGCREQTLEPPTSCALATLIRPRSARRRGGTAAPASDALLGGRATGPCTSTIERCRSRRGVPDWLSRGRLAYSSSNCFTIDPMRITCRSVTDSDASSRPPRSSPRCVRPIHRARPRSAQRPRWAPFASVRHTFLSESTGM